MLIYELNFLNAEEDSISFTLPKKKDPKNHSEMSLREKEFMASKKEKFTSVVGGTAGTLAREGKVAFYCMLDCLYSILQHIAFCGSDVSKEN